MENTILRWSTVCTVSSAQSAELTSLCKREFSDIRFKAVPYANDTFWVQALLEHERGNGWGHRTGKREPEVRQYAEAMRASLERRSQHKGIGKPADL